MLCFFNLSMLEIAQAVLKIVILLPQPSVAVITGKHNHIQLKRHLLGVFPSYLMYGCVYMCASLCVSVCVCVCVVCLCVLSYVCVCAHLSVCMWYVCVCACTRMCVCGRLISGIILSTSSLPFEAEFLR